MKTTTQHRRARVAHIPFSSDPRSPLLSRIVEDSRLGSIITFTHEMEFIVGTVLAGIPVVLEAYDGYRKLSEGLKTFRHYETELTKLDTIMTTQKTLLRANVVQLLSAITNDEEKAKGLLSESNKEKLNNLKLATLDASRIESLQEMFRSWEAMLELVLHTVTAVCVEVEDFGTRSMSKRFRLCWKKNEVQDSIRELRDFTADLNELTARIVNELKQLQNTNSPAQEMRRKASHNGLEGYRLVRSASYKLYEVFALRWSCSSHQKHGASMSLVNEIGSIQSKNAKDGIVFNVVIDYGADPASRREKPILLEIEIIDGDHPVTPICTTENTESDDAWTGVMQRLTNHSQRTVMEMVHKRRDQKPLQVRSANASRVSAVSEVSSMRVTQSTASDHQDEEALPSCIPVAIENSATTSSMIDFSTIENFCRVFEVVDPICSNTCVGYIHDGSVHRFHLPPPGRRRSENDKSLSDIISWISEGQLCRDPPRLAILHIASSLATAVLQYYSTPWLPDTWSSSQVRLFGVGDLSEDADGTSATPHFRVEFPSRTPVSTSITVVRNEILFRFSIILLKLGYAQLWPQLRRRLLTALPPQTNSDYHVADKLVQRPFLRSRMGQTFTTIVRKCLGCDFGLGENNLENEDLQGMFLVEVVGELQAIERSLKESIH